MNKLELVKLTTEDKKELAEIEYIIDLNVNSILKINDYLEPHLLEAGISLHFDATEGKIFRPGDYWTFPIRIMNKVGELNRLLPKNKTPDGIKYHLVPLAIFSKKEKNRGVDSGPRPFVG